MASPGVVGALLGSMGAVATLFAVSAGQAALVAPLADATVALLLRLSAPLSSPGPAEPLPASLPPLELVSEPSTPSAAPGKPRRARSPAVKPSALFISSAQVLALAQSQARPSGRFVGAQQGRPAGLLLSGVGSLGVGLQEGDVLIEALGSAPTSPGQVIGAIIEARARRASALGGTLWRGGHTFRITVEQPYPGAPAPP